jgi:hypothetical protein
MRVTFDTQVWNRMVFPDRYSDSPNHAAFVKINTASLINFLHIEAVGGIGNLVLWKLGHQHSHLLRKG